MLVPPGARGLLVTLDYEPPIAAGPPFSVSDAEVQKLYAPQFTVKRIERNEVLSHKPRFLDRGITFMHEQACALSPCEIQTTF